jgi:hypothetical protein
MSEQKPDKEDYLDRIAQEANEPEPKKMVRRNVAVALGIICIVLAIGLVGAIAGYTSMINGKDSTISSQASQISSYQNQVNNLTNTLDLSESTVWVNNQTISQAAYRYTFWTYSINNAGYVSVNVQSSTTNNTYVTVNWYLDGILYYNNVTVGTSGRAVFPVLPTLPYGELSGSNYILIKVGNTNKVGNATETVSITYYY